MRYFSALLLFLLTAAPLWAQEGELEQPTRTDTTQTDDTKPEDSAHAPTHTHRPDSHAPIGVMGDHMHKKGEWMVSYRYKTMNMDGSLNGSSGVSDRTVLSRYMVTPTKMSMNAHMFGAMTAPSDDVTLMFMMPYLEKSMAHLTRAGGRFSTYSSGLGDIKAAALVKLWENDHHHLHFNAGLSLPTGSTDARDTTPTGPNTLLPYPMQLGSGTFDLMPGMTYTGFSDHWSWGAQALGTIRMGSNKHGYALGNMGDLSLWGARKWSDNLSTSLRLNGTTWGDISGADPRLNPRMIPTADPSLRAGSRLDLLLGLNGDFGNGHRLAIEGGVPIAQSLDGYQLKTTWTLTAGWQFSF